MESTRKRRPNVRGLSAPRLGHSSASQTQIALAEPLAMDARLLQPALPDFHFPPFPSEGLISLGDVVSTKALHFETR